MLSAVKASGEYRLRVLGLPYGSDKDGQIFDERTDIELRPGDRVPAYYYHGYRERRSAAVKSIGRAVYTGADKAGHWFDVELDPAAPISARIYADATKGEARASSDSAAHLVRPGVAVPGHVSYWPLFALSLMDASTAPYAINPRAVAYAAAKAVIDEFEAGDFPDETGEAAAKAGAAIARRNQSRIGKIDEAISTIKAALDELKAEFTQPDTEREPMAPDSPELPAVKGAKMTTENPEFVKAADVETIVAGKIDAAKAAWLADVDAKIRERNRLGFAGGDKDEDKDGQAAAKAREGALESAFMDYVRTGNRDGLSAAKATMVEGTAANGGYLVPTKYSAELVQTIKEGSVLRAAGARIITVDGTKDFRVPALTNSAAAVLTAESAAYDQKEPTLSEVAFTPYKYTRLSKVSDELLADSRFDVFGQVLAPDGANSFVLAENSAFAVGTGSSQPQGLTVGATVGVTAAATNAITVDEIIDLYYSLKPEYRARATWVVNDATLKVIRKYRESGSTGAFLFQPSLTQGDPSTLMGRPIYSLSTIPTIATGNKAIVFGDLSYFWIADFAGIDMRRLNELYAGSGEVGFRWFKRFDSKVMLAEAVKVLRLA